MAVKLSNYSEIGRGHLKNNMPCQDFSYSFKKDDFYISVVCDGAGSCKYSRDGAEIVAKCVSNLLYKYFDELYIMNEYINKKYVSMLIVSEVMGELTNKSKELNCDIKELSSTLLFVAIKNSRYLAGHIGDGVIGTVENNEVKVLSHPDNGEFANITYFITGNYAIDKLRTYSRLCNGVEGFVLMTDGASESIYHKKDKSLAKICVKLINYLKDNSEEQCRKFLESLLKNEIVKRTIDDCSIALMSLDDVEGSSEFSKFKMEYYYIKKSSSLNIVLKEITKKYGDYLYNIGIDCYKNGDLNNAKRYFEELLDMGIINKDVEEIYKILTTIYYNLGNYYYKDKNYNYAMECYGSSTKYCKNIMCGSSHLKMIEDKASKCRFVKHKHEYVELLVRHGEILFGKGNFRGALKKFKGARRTGKRYKIDIDMDIDRLIKKCEDRLNKKMKGGKDYRDKKKTKRFRKKRD
jgi:tetratricopeptide (TPR) repeat protein